RYTTRRKRRGAKRRSNSWRPLDAVVHEVNVTKKMKRSGMTDMRRTRWRSNAQKVSCGPVHAQAQQPCYTNLVQALHSCHACPTASPATLDAESRRSA